MATDPTNYLAGLGGLQSMPGSYQIQQTVALDKLRQQLGQQAVQVGQQKIAENQVKADEAAQFKIDAAAYAANPTASAAASLLARYPDQQKAISESWKTKDEATRQADLRQIGAVHSYLANGKVDAAIEEMQSRVAAEKAAGQDVTDDERLIARLKADPSTAKAVQAQLALQLASVVPDKFGGVVDQLTKDNDGKGQTVGRAIGHYETSPDGTRSFKVDYRDPESDKPQFEKIKNADGSESIVQVSGGETPSAPSGGGQRYTGGWTPRARNGGDNPDDAVDNKIVGVAKILGVDPDADISSLSPAQIAKALAFGEGGAGTLAGRNNNPTNLRDAKTGDYRKFANTDAAIGAAASQVKRNLGRGQTTVRQMIEGLPVGAGKSSAGSGPKVVFTSQPAADDPVDDATINFYAEKIAAGGDLPTLGAGKTAALWRQKILKRAAQIQTGNGLSGGDSNLAQADVKANRSALLQAQKQYTSTVGFEDTFQRNVKEVLRLAPQGVGGSAPIFNRWIQAGRKSIQGDPSVSAFNVAVNTAANEYAKLASGASGGAVTSDSARHEAMEILNNAQTLPQLQASIKQMQIDGHNRVVALDTQIKRLRGNISGAGGTQKSGMPADISAILKKYGH